MLAGNVNDVNKYHHFKVTGPQKMPPTPVSILNIQGSHLPTELICSHGLLEGPLCIDSAYFLPSIHKSLSLSQHFLRGPGPTLPQANTTLLHISLLPNTQPCPMTVAPILNLPCTCYASHVPTCVYTCYRYRHRMRKGTTTKAANRLKTSCTAQSYAIEIENAVNAY